MGQEITIPDWVFALEKIIVLIWMVYLTIMTFKNQAANLVASEKDIAISHDINRLENKLDETKKDFHDSLEKLDNKVEKGFDRIREEIRNALSK